MSDEKKLDAIGNVDPQVGKISQEIVAVRKPGFSNPEVQKKAFAKSLAKRRGELSPDQELVDYTDLPQVVNGKFMPNKAMLTILRYALDPHTGHVRSEWFKQAGLSRTNWYQWMKTPGFLDWWNAAFQKGIEQFHSAWLMIGIKKMPEDYRYWKDVGELVFKYKKQIEVTETSSEEEQKLTEELLKMYTRENKKAEEQTIDAEVVLPQEFINEMNNNKESDVT